MSRIVTVYSGRLRSGRPTDMGDIRWLRVSAALAARGHTVHMATAELKQRYRQPAEYVPGAALVPMRKVRWGDYDMVKTFYHEGFETLVRYGGVGHPFIVSHLGSVVGPDDRPGIYFHGRYRERLYATQRRISTVSRYVTLLCEPAAELWRECFGSDQPIRIVPGATESMIPPPRTDPYPADGRIRVLAAGNFYRDHPLSQPEAHRAITGRLNRLGALLGERGARLFVIGNGQGSSLDPVHVSYLGAVHYEDSWDYFHFADVGIAVTSGPFMHNNESTRLYYYLRAGLPVVSEAGFPNDWVVRESGLGFVVENERPALMAERIVEAAHTEWDHERAVRYVLDEHTWDRRVDVHERLLEEHERVQSS